MHIFKCNIYLFFFSNDALSSIYKCSLNKPVYFIYLFIYLQIINVMFFLYIS